MRRVSILTALRKSKPKCARCGHGVGSHSRNTCKGNATCPCVGFEKGESR
jgi:hypothetical protein